MCLPLRQQPDEPARFVTLEVLHRFEFDVDFMMSGVIARTASAKSEPQVFLKGSPHAIVQLVAHNRLPENWAQVRSYCFSLLFVYIPETVFSQWLVTRHCAAGCSQPPARELGTGGELLPLSASLAAYRPQSFTCFSLRVGCILYTILIRARRMQLCSWLLTTVSQWALVSGTWSISLLGLLKSVKGLLHAAGHSQLTVH